MLAPTLAFPSFTNVADVMNHRPLGRTGLAVSPLGFGAFKIGRNRNVKYPSGYDLPDERAVDRLLNGVLDAGINLIDTAPAYGFAEERIGKAIAHRRDEYVLCTKVGETFSIDECGRPVSTFDFAEESIRASVERSLRRLRTDVLDVLLLHSDGRDLFILRETDAVATLMQLKEDGLVRCIGLSGKTAAGHAAALDWADVIMTEYHIGNRGDEVVIAEAAQAGVGVLVKKGLAAGHLEPGPAIRFVLSNSDVSSLVVGGLNLDHIRENVAYATMIRAAA
jgi:aryl-alcohol dehydrogenase-like predicted oxidoreductase